MTPEPEIAPTKLCLLMIRSGRKAMEASNLPVAKKAFDAAMETARKAPENETEPLCALAMCHLAILESQNDRAEAGRGLRERAMSLVESVAPSQHPFVFNYFMLTALLDLKEYWRAIRFCEQMIRQSPPTEGSSELIELLKVEADCYLRTGLHEMAAVPLRAALKILRDLPGDPRLSSILVALGNVVRRSAPREAEQLFREAAALHESKAQLESATVAWVSVATLYTEEGRHTEALNYFERALRIREADLSGSPVRLGMLLNNMACCHRRLRDFDRALQLVDQAIDAMAKASGPTMASVYNTRGEILYDAGRHQDAVSWFRRSDEARRQSPNPDLQKLSHNLELEIKSLRSLGREDEADIAEEKLAAVRQLRQKAPQVNLELSARKARTEASVLIELNIGHHSMTRYSVRDAETAGEQIAKILQSKELGTYGGRVVIPESTTLLFHGQDGDAMFAAMEQFLADHLIFAGSTVSIHQGTQLRQLVLTQTVN